MKYTFHSFLLGPQQLKKSVDGKKGGLMAVTKLLVGYWGPPDKIRPVIFYDTCLTIFFCHWSVHDECMSLRKRVNNTAKNMDIC